MSNLPIPPSGPTFDWRVFKDWFYRLWKSVTGMTFGTDTTSYSAAIQTTAQDTVGGNTTYIGPNVVLYVTYSNGQSIPNNTNTTLTNWSTPIVDTAKAFNSTTGVYTIPLGGYYLITFNALFSAVAWNAGVQIRGLILRNGTSQQISLHMTEAALTVFESILPLSLVLLCVEGDTISFQTHQENGAAVNMHTDANFTWATITKVG